jgi:retron-type reverse transcriptase
MDLMHRYDLMPSWKRHAIETSLGITKKRCWPSDHTPPVEEIFDHEHLIEIFDQLKSKGGQAPGPDGARYEDFTRPEVCERLRKLSKDVLSGQYVFSEPRLVKIPKASGGTRTLALRSIWCRVISKAMAAAVSPFWEARFLPCSYGFRKGIGRWDLLLDLEQQIYSGSRICIELDIKDAFGSLQIPNVLAVFEQYCDDIKLLKHFEIILRGSRSENQGIGQGDPLSPLALNVLLHHFLDTPFSEAAVTPLHRYADNFILVGKMPEEVREGVQFVHEFLNPLGLFLKDYSEPVDLKHQSLNVLGYEIRLEKDAIRYQLPPSSWQCLEQSLMDCHKAQNPPERANDLLRGWLNSQAPTLENRRINRVVNRVLKLSSSTGFDTSVKDIERWTQSALDTWLAFRQNHVNRRECLLL